MINGIRLAPSLMCVNWLDVRSDITWIENTGIFDFMHIDIVDGRFAPDFTMGSSIIDALRPIMKIPLDFHLMVEEPRSIFDTYNPKKGDIFTVHQECSRNLHRDLVYLKQFGCGVGVALNPATSINTLDYILDDIDRILIMSVDPGFKGGKLVPSVLGKITEAKQLVQSCGLDVEIAVDGNVSIANIPNMIKAGADTLILGSSGLFLKDKTLNESFKLLNQSVMLGSDGLNV